ncbi:MAG: PstS family phosphate ABC transporter substrate-binding protein [Prochlorotrichaceae cyanobacterium]
MIFSAIFRRRNWLALFLTVAFSLIALQADGATRLLGAGSSFAEPLYDQYFANLKDKAGLNVRYLTIGSGQGFRQLGDKVTSFASSDFYPQGEEGQRLLRLDQVPGLELQIAPVALGGVAIIYNINSTGDNGLSPTDVKISREALAGIFSGEITNWQQVSPQLPSLTIKPIVHCDVSGANYILSRYLEAVTDGQIEKRPGPLWWQEAGLDPYAARTLDDGVAAAVASTEGAIGYVQVNYALEKNLETARIENSLGRFVKPELVYVQRAADTIEYDNFRPVGIEDPAIGYPLVGINAIYYYNRQDTTETAEGLNTMLAWMLTDGQELNESYNYLAVNPEIAQLALSNLQQNLTVSPWAKVGPSEPVTPPTREACK